MSSTEATQILVLLGSSALSVTKRSALLRDIQTRSSRVSSIDAVHLHLVECTSSSSKAELSQSKSTTRQILNHLLEYDDDVRLEGTAEASENSLNVVYVVPRAGSISPWSSKATDISGLCGLQDYVRRVERGIFYALTPSDSNPLTDTDLNAFGELLHDRMTQTIHLSLPPADSIFLHRTPAQLRTVDFVSNPETAEHTLATANKELGLALSADEMSYLLDAFVRGTDPLARAPTDAELFMFAQVNSEHCRHKIFNASWTVDGQAKGHSLFNMIRNTERINPRGTVSAYSDNAAVLEGYAPTPRFAAGSDGTYQNKGNEESLILIKVETHNHPTAVSPYPGAATGSGGEIRDEGAVGRGSRPKAGLVGYAVSNLLIPGFEQPWEEDVGKPSHIASAREIMLHAPLGAAAFNDEFGRPALTGFFRTLCEREPGAEGRVRGYHKPIMLAGGLGNVRPDYARKQGITAGAHLVVLGGPGLLIGLGGGAASSQSLGSGSAALDFASVQRDNAEMQRRCQMVIDACTQGPKNPVQSIHDVGAGGLSNALPELVHDAGLGARIEIRDVLVADAGMSPMEIWCNESQERYVLAVSPEESETFAALARRERCPFAVVGVATEEQKLVVTDRLLKEDVIHLKMSTLFGKPPRMSRSDNTTKLAAISFDTTLAKYLPDASPTTRLTEAVKRVLHLPSVASKSFLITIGDRSVTGLVARDQMVGPWQVPVADVAVTRAGYGFDVRHGEAMAIGERTPAALLSAPASARMAVGEALTNLVAADVAELGRVKLSANWMCAASTKGEGAALYAAVQAIGMELCPELGVGIPVGKDSMSMAMRWENDHGEQKDVTAPLSLIVTAFAPVEDIRRTWTPQLRRDVDSPTVLVLIDLSGGKQRLGASALAQVFREFGEETPDVENPTALRGFLNACRILRKDHPEVVLAYHDRSDGGLITTILEMAFAGRVGVELSLDVLGTNVDPVAALFNEELGGVIQVREQDLKTVMTVFVEAGVPSKYIHAVGRVNQDVQNQTVKVIQTSDVIFSSTRHELQELWSETSYHMQAARDDPEIAREEHALIRDAEHTGLFYELTFTPSPTAGRLSRPKVAILREQGVNGHMEMAWSFSAAGFESVDVHMSDILSGSISLANFRGFAACGGFSYGDVLGAGKGWAHSALLNPTARKEFEAFFKRADTFALGVCNGCQFLSHMKELVPGASAWPAFRPNRGGRFEARASMVEIPDGGATRSSVFLRDMAGSRLPVAVAHGEGRAAFASPEAEYAVRAGGLAAVRYVDGKGRPTQLYPLNPNGSPEGLAGVQTPDGRVLALMPHPERVTMLDANSWFPSSKAEEWKGVGPWFRLFQSARQWCG